MFSLKDHSLKYIFLVLGILIFKINHSQTDNSKFGFTLNPIVPVNYFGAGPLTIENDTANLTLSSKIGYQFGMLWRTDFSDHFTLESGILFTRRNFKKLWWKTTS